MSAQRMDGVVACDVETGGFDFRRNPLLAVGLYTMPPSGVGFSWQVLIQRDPAKEVDEVAAKLIGWRSDWQWEDRGAVPLAEALIAVRKKIEWLHLEWNGRSNLRMLAHNSGFDRDRFLEVAMQDHGIAPLALWRRWECSMAALAFCRRAGLLERDGACDLDALTALRTGDPVVKRRTHSAASDAMLTWLGYEWLVGRVKSEMERVKCPEAEAEGGDLADLITNNETNP